jgi:nitroreductase
MKMVFNEESNKALDSIIENRRSVRAFKPDIPSKDLIEKIVHAGLWAPYAMLAVGDTQDFRRFFVMQGNSPSLKKVSDCVQEQSRIFLEQMKKTFEEKPFLREKTGRFVNFISSMAENGAPSILNAPCLIIIAEHKGMPAVEKQSLAHVVQNMWLKATALGLGLQLISMIESLGENKGLCDLLGLKLGECAFNGCIVGYAAQPPQAGKRPDDERVTLWL